MGIAYTEIEQTCVLFRTRGHRFLDSALDTYANRHETPQHERCIIGKTKQYRSTGRGPLVLRCSQGQERPSGEHLIYKLVLNAKESIPRKHGHTGLPCGMQGERSALAVPALPSLQECTGKIIWMCMCVQPKTSLLATLVFWSEPFLLDRRPGLTDIRWKCDSTRATFCSSFRPRVSRRRMARFALPLVVLALAFVVSAAPIAQIKRALPTPVAVSTAKTYLSQCAAFFFFFHAI